MLSEERLRNAKRVLDVIKDLSGGSLEDSTDSFDIVAATGMTPEAVEECVIRLKSMGAVTYRAFPSGVSVRLTEYGAHLS